MKEFKQFKRILCLVPRKCWATILEPEILLIQKTQTQRQQKSQVSSEGVKQESENQNKCSSAQVHGLQVPVSDTTCETQGAPVTPWEQNTEAPPISISHLGQQR